MEQRFLKLLADESHDLVNHRCKGDQEKAVSYLNAFSRSCIPIRLINWVTSQSSVGGMIIQSNVSTPIALISEFLDNIQILSQILTLRLLPLQLQMVVTKSFKSLVGYFSEYGYILKSIFVSLSLPW